jgi:CheY-like chemotaxis protein
MQENAVEPAITILSDNRILIVDDNETSKAILKTQLEKWGAITLVVSSAKQALDTIEKNEVDLVITDYDMPHMNGLQLAIELKRLRKQLPIVLLGSVNNIYRQEHGYLFCATLISVLP